MTLQEYVRANPGKTSTQIAKAIGRTQSSVSGGLVGLLDRNLITKQNKGYWHISIDILKEWKSYLIQLTEQGSGDIPDDAISWIEGFICGLANADAITTAEEHELLQWASSLKQVVI